MSAPQYMVHIDETEYGPISEREMQVWANEERIQPSTTVRLSTGREWIQAGSLSLAFPSDQAMTQQTPTIIINNQASVTSYERDYDYSRQPGGGTSNGVAAICSLLMPGLGQFVQGRIGAGVAYLVGAIVSFISILFVIGLFLYPLICLASIIDAAVYKPPRRRQRRRY